MGIATLVPKAIPFKFLFEEPPKIEKFSDWSAPRSAITGRELQLSRWSAPVSRKTRRRRRG